MPRSSIFSKARRRSSAWSSPAASSQGLIYPKMRCCVALFLSKKSDTTPHFRHLYSILLCNGDSVHEHVSEADQEAQTWQNMSHRDLDYCRHRCDTHYFTVILSLAGLSSITRAAIISRTRDIWSLIYYLSQLYPRDPLEHRTLPVLLHRPLCRQRGL